MNCKYCGEPMPERGNFCSVCGRDNAEEVTAQEEMTFEEVQIVPPEEEIPAGEVQAEEFLAPEVKKAKRTAAIVGCFAVLAVLALALFFGIRGEAFSGQMFRANDIFKKESYTLADDKAESKADVVVATLGDAKLTNGQLQIYYQMSVIEFLNQYSYYLSYFGLDYTKPLDQQPCALLEGYTWQQYFLETALNTWMQNQALAIEAEKNGFQLDEVYQSRLDSVDQDMAASATANGFDSADAFLQSQCGSNTDMDDYKVYMNTYFNGYLYFSQLCETIETPSDEDLAAYFQTNKAELEAQGIKQDGSYLVDVRHILIKVEGGVENADGTITFPDAAVAAEAKVKAEQILAQWQENPTEENFGILAKEHTADSNGAAGGLYTDVSQGYMVKTFNDWCFDPARQVGDYGIVETKFGYHIMYFSGRGEEIWLTNTRQYYLSQQQTALLEQVLEQYGMTVRYSKIALTHVDLV